MQWHKYGENNFEGVNNFTEKIKDESESIIGARTSELK